MNRVELTGRLTRDPAVSVTTAQMTIARFTLAVNRRKKGEADFVSCTAFGKTAETIEKHLKRGALIGVCGRIQTGSYTDRNGNKVFTTDVIVEEFDFLEKKSEATELPAPADDWMHIPDNVGEEGLPF